MSAAARLAGRSVGLVAGTVLRHPTLFVGLTAFALSAVLISGNALFSQPFAHPQPMLTTRGPAVPSVPLASAPTAPEVWRPVNDPRIMSVPLVREVQELLAQAGYYGASIDGRPGQATDRAIRRFQAERGLRVDGMATPLLLTQIRQMTGPAPSPETRPGSGEVASLEERIAELETGAISGGADASLDDRELVRRIQSELSAAAVAQLQADGILGEQTRSAIRTFQALEGLEVTGEPSPALLDRLAEIGRRP